MVVSACIGDGAVFGFVEFERHDDVARAIQVSFIAKYVLLYCRDCKAISGVSQRALVMALSLTLWSLSATMARRT